MLGYLPSEYAEHGCRVVREGTSAISTHSLRKLGRGAFPSTKVPGCFGTFSRGRQRKTRQASAKVFLTWIVLHKHSRLRTISITIWHLEIMSQRPGTARQGSNVNRQQSNTSSTRTSTRHGDNINLAGPPERSRRRDVHQTFIEEGYRDLNPWMQEDEEQQNSDFSLAGTFPHKIRFQGRPQRDQPTQQVYKPGEEKGETEPAPQVAAAEDQQLEQQHSRGSVGRRNEQQQQAREDRGSCCVDPTMTDLHLTSGQSIQTLTSWPTRRRTGQNRQSSSVVWTHSGRIIRP